MNLYSIKDVENFALIDSPGDTEIDSYLEFFVKKGYSYSKLFIYVMDERKTLDTDSMKNNIKLETLLNLRLNYKIPLLILLTHSDNYCDEIKKTASNWKDICKNNINDNKKNLLEYINNGINEMDYKMKENDIIHTVLIDLNSIDTITDKEIIESFDEEDKKDYENDDEKGKEKMLRRMRKGMKLKENEVEKFLKEMNVFGRKELVEKMKEIFPSHFHNVFIEIK